jgi:hypothetical protein
MYQSAASSRCPQALRALIPASNSSGARLVASRTVEVNKRADLLLVKKNPLKRIGNLKKISGVMVNGVWLSKQELDARLESLADKWAS